MSSPTKKQVEVIMHKGSHARIIAGPGSGKSRTLIGHIRKSLEDESSKPKELLILAFNRPIADKLKEDLSEHLGEDDSNLPIIMTLHSYALKLLKRFRISSEVGNATFPSENEMPLIYKIVSRYLEQKKCTHRGKKVNAVTVEKGLYIPYAKHYWFGVKEIKEEDKGILKQMDDAMTFVKDFFGIRFLGELPAELRKLVNKEPEARMFYKKIIIDEYQDLNFEDIELIKSLVQGGTEVIVAGDDDQSICSYRGANSQGLKIFSEEYADVKTFELDECFRCPKKIFDYGQEIVSQIPDDERIKKETRCSVGFNGFLANWVFKNPASQKKYIFAILKKYLEKEKENSVLIVVPKNDYIKEYTEQLKQQGFEVEDLMTIKSDENLQKFWLMLRAMVNPSDQLAMYGILNIKEKNWSKIFEKVVSKLDWTKYRQTLVQALLDTRAELESSLRGENKKALEDVFEVIKTIDKNRKSVVFDVNAIKASLLEISRICEEFYEGYDGNTVKATIDEVDKQISEFRSDIKEPFEVLSYFLPIIEEKPAPNPNIKLKITTLGKAKGLEADFVIVPDLEDNALPGQRDLSEARRLLYVAVTRAKKGLIISSVRMRIGGYMAGDKNPIKQPSRLLPTSIRIESGEIEASKVLENISVITETK